MKPLYLFVFWLAAANLLLFVLMGADKRAARRHRRRIRETTLLALAVLGGSLGGLLAMPVFHHKTKKPAFFLGIPVIFLVQLAAGFLIVRFA